MALVTKEDQLQLTLSLFYKQPVYKQQYSDLKLVKQLHSDFNLPKQL